MRLRPPHEVEHVFTSMFMRLEPTLYLFERVGKSPWVFRGAKQILIPEITGFGAENRGIYIQE